MESIYRILAGTAALYAVYGVFWAFMKKDITGNKLQAMCCFLFALCLLLLCLVLHNVIIDNWAVVIEDTPVYSEPPNEPTNFGTL